MGTNYYLYRKNPESVPKHFRKPLHIGKSSAGWVFSLHIHPEYGIHYLYNWHELFFNKDFIIKDEYGNVIDPGEMIRIITDRKNYYGKSLKRHKVDGDFCLGHGKGTWDYIYGDFC